MTERLIDILPLIQQLAQKKSIAHGLMIGQQCSLADWPGEWQTLAFHQLEKLPFTQRFDLAVVDLTQSNTITSPSHDYEGKLILGKVNPLTNTATSQPDSAISNLDFLAKQKSLTQGLTRLRDLLARQVLVLANQQYSSLLHTLGFSQVEQLEQEMFIWQFNILSYKQTPDWLNSKYWANPENWDKYRW